MIVVDTSIALKWLVREDDSDKAEALIGREMVAPELLLAETANALWKKFRRGEIMREQLAAGIGAIGSFAVVVPIHDLAARALEIAIELDHPVYDCFYLALAERLDVPLVTADERFRKSIDRSAIRTNLLTLGDFP